MSILMYFGQKIKKA